jgi:chromosomal replication initiation ATPase DnaA
MRGSLLSGAVSPAVRAAESEAVSFRAKTLASPQPTMLVVHRERAEAAAVVVAMRTRVPAAVILGRSREPEAVAARHTLFAMLHDEGMPMAAIARAVGMHHTSVMTALRNMRSRR